MVVWKFSGPRIYPIQSPALMRCSYGSRRRRSTRWMASFGWVISQSPRSPRWFWARRRLASLTANGAGFKARERVIVYGGGLGVFRDGTWAEAVAVPAFCLRRLPDGMSFEKGAALANVGVTAYGALRTAELKAGERLVVLGATGGVGSAGVQIGKAIGARVIAVVPTDGKASTLQALGAAHVVALADG